MKNSASFSPRRSPNTVRSGLLVFAATFLAASSSFALGEVTKGTVDLADASTDKAQHDPTTTTDTTELAIQGGGLLASGNASSLAITSGGRFFLRRGQHEGLASVVGNYARGQLPGATEADTTVENMQARMRYDYFFSQQFSGFFALYGRHDRFQGLDFRFAMDPGVAAYFLRTDPRSVWLEGGYDLQIDDRTADALNAARLAGTPESDLEDPKVVHNARIYLGYREKIQDRLKFELGVEFFKSLIDAEAFRLNSAAELNTQLVDRFSLSLGVQSFYDSAPLAGLKQLDLTTTLSFVYTML